MQWKALVSLLLSCSEAVSIILFLILTSIIIVIDGYNFIWGFLLLYNVAEIYLCLWQIHRLIFFLSSPLLFPSTQGPGKQPAHLPLPLLCSKVEEELSSSTHTYTHSSLCWLRARDWNVAN